MEREKESVVIFWFRRDLRIEDNAALYYALKEHTNVIPLFIFDSNIFEKLDNKFDRRVDFIHQVLCDINLKLKSLGTSLIVKTGKPIEVFQNLMNDYQIDKVFVNHDYEPQTISRDKKVVQVLLEKDIPFLSFKDQVIFEKDEILKDDGSPYTVFTPFSKKWKNKVNQFYVKPYPCENYFFNFKKIEFSEIVALNEIGFHKTELKFEVPDLDQELIRNYAKNRDFPAVNGTTRLSVHLRFGTISIRRLTTLALTLNEVWLNELIWREFYMSILYHFPHVVSGAFKPKYNYINWRNNVEEFEAWCNGNTGYPIVDAGMRELNNTGFMHNRVRMIVASFLTKHLLIDWRWGEAYFAEKLLDFDLSANNGGWQWAAGTGCDAAPYFRIFNPYEQTKKFDSELAYVNKWVPEFQEFAYPKPIVEHKFARERALNVYKSSLEFNN